jgi:DNA-binding response OmpR family regulator
MTFLWLEPKVDRKKILIIDGDFESVSLLTKILSEENFFVTTAYDGEEGLNKVLSDKPDLIIMEPYLKKLHGFDLCMILSRDFDPKIPVIILSGYYHESFFRNEALQTFGAEAFVSKPYHKDKLLSTIDELIGDKD